VGRCRPRWARWGTEARDEGGRAQRTPWPGVPRRFARPIRVSSRRHDFPEPESSRGRRARFLPFLRHPRPLEELPLFFCMQMQRIGCTIASFSIQGKTRIQGELGSLFARWAEPKVTRCGPTKLSNGRVRVNSLRMG